MTGITRLRSSSTSMGWEPGRVDSPPTSRSASPWRSHRLSVGGARVPHHLFLRRPGCIQNGHQPSAPEHGDPVAQLERISLEDLAVQPLVSYHRSYSGRSRVDQAFAALWRLNPRQLDKEPHIDEIIEECRVLYDEREEWERTKAAVTAPSAMMKEEKSRSFGSDSAAPAPAAEAPAAAA